MSKTYDVAVVPGDGIGPEVVAAARGVLQRAAECFGFALRWREFQLGAERYLKTGETLPASVLDELSDVGTMLLGAVGDPRVKPGVLEQGILLPLRFHFDQYVNLRPAKSYPGVPLPVAVPEGERIDTVVVRENTEDLYMNLGGRSSDSKPLPLEARRGLYRLEGGVDFELAPKMEYGFSVGLMSRPGIERITRYAGQLARRRGEKAVNVVSKANAVPGLYGFWDDVTRSVLADEFPELEYRSFNVDAMAYLAARKPWGWGVLLCPNLFGDILSDLFAGLTGGLGLAASGNIGERLSMFEPVHGSAPDLAGSGRANPLAAVLAGAMLLDHLGETPAADAVREAVVAYLARGGDGLPCELGGRALAPHVGAAVTERLSQRIH